ncbi:hypothetical protein ACLOJK_023406, partial [Asimina triloba]
QLAPPWGLTEYWKSIEEYPTVSNNNRQKDPVGYSMNKSIEHYPTLSNSIGQQDPIGYSVNEYGVKRGSKQHKEGEFGLKKFWRKSLHE